MVQSKELKLYDATYTIFNNGTVIGPSGKVLKQHKDKDGYLYFLYGKGRNHFFTHRAVAICFVPNPEPSTKKEVHHKDNNRANPSADNLQWVSHAENIRKAAENGVNAAYLFYRQQSQPHFSLYHFLPVLEKESILKRQKEKETPSRYETEKKQISLIEKEENIQENTDAYNFELEESVKNVEDKEKGVLKIFLLILSLICLMIGLLPIFNTVIRISCMAFSALLFVVFIIVIFEKHKKNNNFFESENNDVSSMQKIDVGTNETIFFDSFENEDYLKLQWKEKGRKKQFVLKEFPCTVGKMKEEVNLCISDISVSRIHCRFVEQENKICIMDLNSTNGTFLNGLSLKSGEVLEIEKNDEILLGKVKLNVV